MLILIQPRTMTSWPVHCIQTTRSHQLLECFLPANTRIVNIPPRFMGHFCPACAKLPELRSKHKGGHIIFYVLCKFSTFIGPLASSGERLCNEMQSHLDIGSGSARSQFPNQPNVQPLRTLHDPLNRNLQQYENIGSGSAPNVQQLPTLHGSNRNLQQQYQQQANANSRKF
jgi:hypothetical protein